MILNLWHAWLTAVQFLTRIPVPAPPYSDLSLPRAAKFFPLVGLLLGAMAGGLYLLLDPHLPRLVTAALVLVALVALTGCLHEDALADAADGFGGGWNRDQILAILRDSRIGSYGGTALVLSLGLRLVLLASLQRGAVLPVLMTAHLLCRWTALPLSYSLPAARAAELQTPAGQGARVAGLVTGGTLATATVFTFAVAILLLRRQSLAPLLAAVAITLLSGLYYRRRIRGITGDCLGATNQVTEIAVYLCGVWAA